MKFKVGDKVVWYNKKVPICYVDQPFTISKIWNDTLYFKELDDGSHWKDCWKLHYSSEFNNKLEEIIS